MGYLNGQNQPAPPPAPVDNEGKTPYVKMPKNGDEIRVRLIPDPTGNWDIKAGEHWIDPQTLAELVGLSSTELAYIVKKTNNKALPPIHCVKQHRGDDCVVCEKFFTIDKDDSAGKRPYRLGRKNYMWCIVRDEEEKGPQLLQLGVTYYKEVHDIFAQSTKDNAKDPNEYDIKNPFDLGPNGCDIRILGKDDPKGILPVVRTFSSTKNCGLAATEDECEAIMSQVTPLEDTLRVMSPREFADSLLKGINGEDSAEGFTATDDESVSSLQASI